MYFNTSNSAENLGKEQRTAVAATDAAYIIPLQHPARVVDLNSKIFNNSYR